jgi:uncharacterized membrane protein
MKQSKLESVFEAMTNTFVRLPFNYFLAMVVYPMLGWPASSGMVFGATMIFTASSLVLGYVIRRFFNAGLHRVAQDLARKWMEVFGK